MNILSKYNGVTAQEKSNSASATAFYTPYPLPPLQHQALLRQQIRRRTQPHHRHLPRAQSRPRPLRRAKPITYPPGEPIWYDLVANITHEAVKKKDDSVEGEQESKVWRVQAKDRSREEWYGIQDLYVEKERGETLFTKEAYVMVWEKRRGQMPAGSGSAKGKTKV